MMRVSEIMTSDVSSISPDMTLREALEELRARNVTGAPVVQGSRVVGVLSMSDLLDFAATSPSVPSFREDHADWGEWGEPETWQEGESPPLFFVELWADAAADAVERITATEGPEWDFLADHVVAETMSRKLVSVAPDDDVRLAAQRMSAAGGHRVLVLEGTALVGVLSASDIVRAVADGSL